MNYLLTSRSLSVFKEPRRKKQNSQYISSRILYSHDPMSFIFLPRDVALTLECLTFQANQGFQDEDIVSNSSSIEHLSVALTWVWAV